MEELEQHYRENRDRYVKIATRRLSGDFGLAEDAVQNTYLRAMEFMHCFNPEIRNLSSWINAIFNNCVKDMKFQHNDVLVEQMDVPIELSLEREMLDDVVRALNKYYGSNKRLVQREVLYYFYIKQLKPNEIKMLVDKVSYDNIYKIISRFKTLMKGM